jgi:hypothetical protein
VLKFFVKKWVTTDAERADVSFLPPMKRRRLSLTARMALRAAHDCLDGQQGMNSVFCTRYGEFEKCFGILKDICAGDGVSPAAFSHSVHNFAPGIFSITTGNTANSTLVSANAATLENAVIEAASVAKEQSCDVLLVYFDAALPAEYYTFSREEEASACLAMIVSSEEGVPVSLSWQKRTKLGPTPAGISASVITLVSLIEGTTDTATVDDGRLVWSWKQGHS